MRELIPTARVRHGTPRELPVAPVGNLLQAEIVPSEGDPIAVTTFLKQSSTDAIVVLVDGNIAFEWYAPDVSPDEPHVMMSVTKSITALLAGALAGAGKLDLEAPVADYIPESSGSCYEDATVRHLLDMTVGAAFVEDYTPGEDVRAYRQSTGWYRRQGDGPDLHSYLCTIKHAGEHGGVFRYVSINTDMLGWVCERAGGGTYADLVSEHLWVPMGAEADADITLDRAGGARAAGGLCVTARDLARVGQLVIEDGAGAVPAEFVRDLREGGEPDPGPDLGRLRRLGLPQLLVPASVGAGPGLCHRYLRTVVVRRPRAQGGGRQAVVAGGGQRCPRRAAGRQRRPGHRPLRHGNRCLAPIDSSAEGAAVDHVARARDERGLIGGQEVHQRGHLLLGAGSGDRLSGHRLGHRGTRRGPLDLGDAAGRPSPTCWSRSRSQGSRR